MCKVSLAVLLLSHFASSSIYDPQLKATLLQKRFLSMFFGDHTPRGPWEQVPDPRLVMLMGICKFPRAFTTKLHNKANYGQLEDREFAQPTSYPICSVSSGGSRPWAKRGARFWFTYPAGFSPFCPFLHFFNPKKGGAVPPGPSPRSATGILLHSCLFSFH